MSKKSEKIDAVEAYRANIVSQFSARSAYEFSKNSENTNIQKTLADLQSSVDHNAIAKVMLAANVDAAFINRAERANARFNVYSADKIVNIARFAASAATLNHYTLNIVRSIAACENASVDFTQRDAVAACSLTAKVDSSKAHLISQYQKHVALNTASTQSSSSLNALLMTNVIVEYRNAANVTCFKVSDSDFASEFVLKAHA